MEQQPAPNLQTPPSPQPAQDKANLPQPKDMLITSEATPKKSKLIFILLGIFVILLVGASTFFIAKSLKKPVLAPQPQVSPQTAPLPVQITDETADWKIYTNAKYGYYVKYPNNWSYLGTDEAIARIKNTVRFWPNDINPTDSEAKGIWINIRDERFSYTDLDSWWVENKKSMLIPLDINSIAETEALKDNFEAWISVQKVSISETPALKVETKASYPDRPYRSIFLMDKNKEIIELNTNITEKSSPHYSVFDQILSTFKFTNQTSTDEMADWITFELQNGFIFKYPEKVKIEEVQEVINLSLWGPTQKKDTEFYDGIFLGFRLRKLPADQTLKAYIDSEIEIEKDKQVYEIIKPLEAISVNNYQGFTYSLRGAVAQKFTYLQDSKRPQIFIQITDSTSDPTNQGFKSVVDQILSTFKFLD